MALTRHTIVLVALGLFLSVILLMQPWVVRSKNCKCNLCRCAQRYGQCAC